MIMDFGRFPYDTKCRFFANEPRETDIKWYAAATTAKCFPVPHKFGQLRWVSEPWLAEGVGEVYGSPDRFNGATAPPGLVGDHYFGPVEGFQQGLNYDPEVITPRNNFGLALGCLPADMAAVMLMEEFGEPPVLMEDQSFILLEDQP